MNKDMYVLPAHKHDVALLKKIVTALEQKTVKRFSYIPYPEVHCVLGRVFHFNKEAGRHILFELRRMQLIEEIPYHGIRILKPESLTLAKRSTGCYVADDENEGREQ